MRVRSLCVLLLATPLCLRGAPPVLEYLFPAAASRGATNEITIGGKFDWPSQMWTGAEAIRFIPGTNSGKFRLETDPQAPLGPRWVRLYNTNGASEARLFIITSFPSILEKEPNDSLKEAQPLPALPQAAQGRLEKRGDSDAYALDLAGGLWLAASVDASRIGSAIDPVLHLYNSNGVQVAFSHDGHRLDPLLGYYVKEPGRYYLRVHGFANPAASDVNFFGGPAVVYQLSATQGPFAWGIYPAVYSTNQVDWRWTGWNLPSSGPGHHDFIGPQGLPSASSSVAVAKEGQWLRVPRTDWPVVVETEPNDGTNISQKLSLPVTLCGHIDKPGDLDRYHIHVRKDARYLFRTRTSSFNSPLEPRLMIQTLAGKTVYEHQENDLRLEHQMSWKADADEYYFTVADLGERGGANFYYTLELSETPSSFKATLPQQTILLERGKSAEIKIQIDYTGEFNSPLEMTASNLPPGVAVAPMEVTAKAKEAILKLIASSDAAPANQPVYIWARRKDSAESKIPVCLIHPPDEAGGELLLPELDHLWLTVQSPR